MGKVEKHEAKQHKGGEKEAKKGEPAQQISPFDDTERMFAGLFPRGWLRPFSWEHPFWSEWLRFESATLPRIDIIDRDHEIVVRALVPGVHKENLEISVSDRLLTIKGSTSHEEKEEKGDYYRRECSHGSFSRTVALPEGADSTKAKASFKDGVLELVMPKAGKAERHSVTIE